MSWNRPLMFRILLMLGCALLLVGSVQPAGADTGVLKLKVMRCSGSGWLTGAQVDVSVTRSGSEIASATDYTNGSGYVEFTFSNLRTGDQAHVTVTPNGESPDSSHVYYWRFQEELGGLAWDISDVDVSCSDYWFDEKNDVILCLYH
jgi:hypothetical protein